MGLVPTKGGAGLLIYNINLPLGDQSGQMIGSQFYHRTRREARLKVEAENRPFWLRTYAEIVKVQQSSTVFQALLQTLRPWERDINTSAPSAEQQDPRWSAFRDRPRNRLAISIRKFVTQRLWFEGFITAIIILGGIVTGMVRNLVAMYAFH